MRKSKFTMLCFSMVMFLMLMCVGKVNAESTSFNEIFGAARANVASIVYDEVIFAPVVLAEHKGQMYLEVDEMDGTWSYLIKDFAKLEATLKQAQAKKIPLAFYLQLGTIVKISTFEQENFYLPPYYDETRDYFAINFMLPEASVRYRLKISKIDNPISYKMSNAYVESFEDIVTVYFVGNEVIYMHSVMTDME